MSELDLALNNGPEVESEIENAIDEESEAVTFGGDSVTFDGDDVEW